MIHAKQSITTSSYIIIHAPISHKWRLVQRIKGYKKRYIQNVLVYGGRNNLWAIP